MRKLPILNYNRFFLCVYFTFLSFHHSEIEKNSIHFHARGYNWNLVFTNNMLRSWKTICFLEEQYVKILDQNIQKLTKNTNSMWCGCMLRLKLACYSAITSPSCLISESASCRANWANARDAAIILMIYCPLFAWSMNSPDRINRTSKLHCGCLIHVVKATTVHRFGHTLQKKTTRLQAQLTKLFVVIAFKSVLGRNISSLASVNVAHAFSLFQCR